AFFEPLAWSYVIAVLISLAVASTITPALAMLLTARVPAARSGSAFIDGLQRHYSRLTVIAVRSQNLAWALIAAGVVVCALAWMQRDRSLIPVFKETDLFVELTAPPGTSLQAMDRIAATMVHDIRAIPGVHDAAAQIGRALLSHETADVNSAEVWVSLDPAADYGAALRALRGVVQAQSGASGEVQTFLSKRMRESLTGED